MPIVPGSVAPISQDVPGAPSLFAGAGVVEDALAKASGQIADASSQLYVRIRHAEAEAIVTDRLQKQTDDMERWKEKQKLLSRDGNAYKEDGTPLINPDGTPLSLTDHYKQTSERLFQDTMDQLPNSYAQQRYREEMGKKFHEIGAAVHQDELGARIKNVANLREDRIRREMNKQSDLPSQTSFYSFLDSERKLLRDNQGVIYSPDDVHNLDSALLKEAPDGLFVGYKDAILSNKRLESEGVVGKNGTRPMRIATAREALSILHGTDAESEDRRRRGMPVLSEIMDPDRKAHWLDIFEQLNKVAAKHDKNDWAERGELMANSLQNGEGVVTPRMIREFYNEGIALRQADPKNISDITFIDRLADIAAKKNAEPVLRSWEFYLSSPSKKAAMMEKLETESLQEVEGLLKANVPGRTGQLMVAGSQVRGRVRASLQQISETAARELEDDFPKAIRKNPGIAQVAESISYVDAGSMNRPSQRAAIRANDRQIENMWSSYADGRPASPVKYLTKDEAKQVGFYLNGTDNSDQKTAYLFGLHAANPKTYNAKINQMIEANILKPSWYVALSIGDNRVFAGEVVNAITNPIPDAKATLEANNSSVAELRAEIYKESKSYVDSLISKNPNSPITSKEVEAINDTLFNMAVRKVATEKAVPSTAAKDVVQSLVDNRFLKVKVSSGLFTSTMHRPPRVVHGQELAQAEHSTIENNLGALRSVDALKALGPDVPNGLPKEIPADRFHETVKNSLKFRLNATQDAYVPTWYDSYHQKRWDLLKDGKPITLPILELRKHVDANDPWYVKAVRGSVDAAGKAQDKLKKALPPAGWELNQDGKGF